VKFLHEIQERQARWRWGSESPVFDNVSWLQGLWASRKTVGITSPPSNLPVYILPLSFVVPSGQSVEGCSADL
jgi:hypothetical protein